MVADGGPVETEASGLGSIEVLVDLALDTLARQGRSPFGTNAAIIARMRKGVNDEN